MDPPQHGGGLLPGGGGVGVEAAPVLALHEPQVIGHGDEPPVHGDVAEGHAVAGGGFRQGGGIAQPPDQHGGHFPTGQIVVGPEILAGGGYRAVGQRRLRRRVEPAGLVHVVKGGLGRPDLLPAEHPHQGGGKGGPGDGLAQAEAALVHALEIAQLRGALDALGGPVLLGYVGIAGGGVGLRQKDQAHQPGKNQYQQAFFHGELLVSFIVQDVFYQIFPS